MRKTSGWLVTASVVGMSFIVGTSAAQAAPAPNAEAMSFTSGIAQNVVVPDGVCSVNAVVAGGFGGVAVDGGVHAAGALASATIDVHAGESIEYTVGANGTDAGTGGQPSGGSSSPSLHSGGGGGGHSSISIGGDLLLLAAGGGGTGGGHTTEAGQGGVGGSDMGNSIPVSGGTVYPGAAGGDGNDLGQVQNPSTRPSGGAGGSDIGGAGGLNPQSAGQNFDWNGAAGASLQGGAGGNDNSTDTGGGGGGGFFGGGGGASSWGQNGDSTSVDFVGGGGGGGSTFVSNSALVADPNVAQNVTADGSAAEPRISLEWVMCSYDLSVTKSVVGTPVFEDGQTVRYSVTVTNDGDDDMAVGDTVSLVDDLATGGKLISVDGLSTSVPAAGEEIPASGIEAYDEVDLSDDPENPNVRPQGLAVGKSVTFVYEVELTGTEPVTNTVTISDRGSEENNTASAEVAPAAPSLALVKTADVEKITKIGQEITYSFEVTNTGNIAIDNVAIDEGEFSGKGEFADPECPTGALEPGASVTCTSVYTAVAADITGDNLTNTATATGETPMGKPVVSEESAAELETVPAPKLELVKTADVQTVTKVGQKVTYTFEVTNTGNVPVEDITVNEGEFSGKGKLGKPVCPTDDDLEPGESITCTAEYSAVAGDLTGKALTNTATAQGTTLYGDAVESNTSAAELDTVAPPATQAPLPVTGGQNVALWAMGATLALGLGGGALVLARRRMA